MEPKRGASMDRVPGIDVSRWQGEVDWQRVKDAGYRFAFIRATIGDFYADPRFYTNWTGAQDAGILVSAYHVVTPNEPAESQIAYFFDVLDGRVSDLPLVMDVERDDGAEVTEISQCVRDCLQFVRARDGRGPIIYTARWCWNRYVLTSAEWQSYDLWTASYTTEPILPRDWSTWRFWQYSERGQVSGISAATDLNWFDGTYEDLLAYAGKEGEVPEIPKTGWRARVTTSKLNVRSGPGTDFEDLGDLYEGDVIDILILSGEDVWVEFEPGKWAAVALEGERYLEPEPSESVHEESDTEQ